MYKIRKYYRLCNVIAGESHPVKEIENMFPKTQIRNRGDKVVPRETVIGGSQPKCIVIW